MNLIMDDLLFLSGNDIPFPEAKVVIHQPSLKEIAFIGEETFFVGCGFLNFSKNLLSDLDKNNLETFNDFDIFMLIITARAQETKANIDAAFLVLELIFPLYQISVRENKIVLTRDQEEFYLDRNNFNKFKVIFAKMFGIDLNQKSSGGYSPDGEMAKKIAEKFKKRHSILNKIQQNEKSSKKFSVLSRYASILAIGLQLSITEIMSWTVYQLYDGIQRFQLKVQWDAYIQAKMAGAKDLDEVDNWMIDLQDQGKNKK